MLDVGEILPNTLVADVPTQIASYNPVNFDKTYKRSCSLQVAL